ncbi:MAG: BatA domain-containing protein [Bacteroidales bacterium]|nr:BatA domain-containing protein [Bacteroidales bacterium]
MQFLHPNILYGLLAVIIPILIHFLNFQKYKNIYFTQTELITDLRQETRRQSTLRHWIILFLRMLVIAMLVLAFAGPFLPKEEKTVSGQKFISVYVDNSFSMQAEKGEGNLLNEARNKAVALAEAFEPSTKYQLLTNEMKGKQQRWMTQEQLMTEIEEINFTPQFRTLSEIIKRQHQLFATSDVRSGQIYLISDFQEVSNDLEDDLFDSTLQYYYMPVEAYQTSNAWIDSIWFASPAILANQTAELNVRLKKTGEMKSVPLKLFVNEKQRFALNVEFDGQIEKTVTVNINIRKTGLHACRIELSDNSIAFDNVFYFTFNIPESLNVLVIHDKEKQNRYLKAFFQNDTLVTAKFNTLKTIDYQSFSNYTAIILDGMKDIPSGLSLALNDFVKKGKSLIIFPDLQTNITSYNNFLSEFDKIQIERKRERKRRIQSVNWDSDFFEGLFLSKPQNPDYPVVFKDLKLNRDITSDAEILITQSDGSPFLMRSRADKGLLYIFSVSCSSESSNFVSHALFSTLYKMVFDGIQTERLYYIPGKNELYVNASIDIQSDEMPILKNPTDDSEIIPQIIQQKRGLSFIADKQIIRSGIRHLIVNNEIADMLAYNYDGRESDTKISNVEEDNPGFVNILDDSPDKIAAKVKKQQTGKQLWQWFLIAALLFLLIEVILLRIWKL